ncbi:MAG: hypothetical protein HYY06_10625 [Deltaproteobacteria bacterium]|nr:hypothetical protein [Deltaproteobacteria bacterium]
MLTLAMMGLPTLGRAQTGGVVVDQAHTFYNLDTRTQNVDDQYKTFWQLRARFGVYGEIPDRSVLKYVVKQGNNVLGRASCQSILRAGAIAGENPVPDLYVNDCRTSREQMLGARGQLTVEWTFINGSTDAETVVDTDTITIRDAPTVDVGNNNRPYYPRPYVDRNSEILSTVL